MPKEKPRKFLNNSINPFYKGVCKMKPLRITMFLVAFLVLPLLRITVFVLRLLTEKGRKIPHFILATVSLSNNPEPNRIMGFLKVGIARLIWKSGHYPHLNPFHQSFSPMTQKPQLFPIVNQERYRSDIWLFLPVGLVLLIWIFVSQQGKSLPTILPLLGIVIAGIIAKPETEHLDEQVSEEDSKNRARSLIKIKDLIIHFRQVNRLTQKELAKMLEITASYISQLESGATPSDKMCLALAKVLGVDEERLRLQAVEERGIPISSFITERGDQTGLTPDELELIKFIREYPEWRKPIMGLVEMGTKEHINGQKEKTENKGDP